MASARAALLGVRAVLAAAVVLAGGAARALPSPASETRFVDYLAIEANEGGASGGHAAIRFGDETYHFQHDAGLLRLTRAASADFLFDYSVLENRGIRVSRVPVPPEVYATLRDAFSERFLSQSREIDRLAALRADAALIALLLDRVRAVERLPHEAALPWAAGGSIEVPGAGFFFADEGAPDDRSFEDSTAPASALVRLRERAARELAPEFVVRRRATLLEEMRHLAPMAHAPADPAWTEGQSYSERYVDRFAALLALDVLERALPLRPDGHRAPADEDLALDDGDRVALGGSADQLEADLVRSLGSDGPGSGFALLVGMARLIALRQSIESGRLVVLDAFPSTARRRVAITARERAILPELERDARDDLARARRDLRASTAPREAQWARVETATNRLLELRGVLDGAEAIRLAPGPFVPDRPARRIDLVLPGARPEELERALAAVRAAEADLQERLAERYGYQLTWRNCVTEIFAVVDQALAAAGESAALGETIAADAPLQFIPFVSDRAVGERWRVGEREKIPSYRERRLRELAERDGEFATALRESTTLTSALYERRGAKDSAFLFYTDRAPVLRPALGAANLAVGLGVAAVGLPLAPFDDGDALSSGLRGALFSLPELAFVEIRKGSFDWVARRESGLAGLATP